jgi:hypothetical protein
MLGKRLPVPIEKAYRYPLAAFASCIRYRAQTAWLNIYGIVVPFPAGKEFVVILTGSTLPLEPTKHHIQWVPVAFPPRVKQRRRETDYLPPTSAEVKNTWSSTSTSPTVFVAWYLLIAKVKGKGKSIPVTGGGGP